MNYCVIFLGKTTYTNIILNKYKLNLPVPWDGLAQASKGWDTYQDSKSADPSTLAANTKQLRTKLSQWKK